MLMPAGRARRAAPSALRLYLFDNPILRLDMLLFRRRIAAIFTKHGWRTLALYVLFPAIASFFISRWLFPPPYDKWSFVIFLKTMGTMTLALIGVIAVVYYIVDCAILAVNPLGLRARDALIDDPPVADDYEGMLFYARVLRGFRLLPLTIFFSIFVIFKEFSEMKHFAEDAGWYAVVVFVSIAAVMSAAHFMAIFNLAFLYVNSAFVRMVVAVGVAITAASPFILGVALAHDKYHYANYAIDKPNILPIAWAIHPFGSAVAFLNSIPYTYWNNTGIHMDEKPLDYVFLTILLQAFFISIAWIFVRSRFKKMIRENYLQKAKRG